MFAFCDVTLILFNIESAKVPLYGRLVAPSKLSILGLCETLFSGITIYSAIVPEAQKALVNQTSSPISKRFTLLPMSTTIPVQSLPNVIGSTS